MPLLLHLSLYISGFMPFPFFFLLRALPVALRGCWGWCLCEHHFPLSCTTTTHRDAVALLAFISSNLLLHFLSLFPFLTTRSPRRSTWLLELVLQRSASIIFLHHISSLAFSHFPPLSYFPFRCFCLSLCFISYDPFVSADWCLLSFARVSHTSALRGPRRLPIISTSSLTDCFSSRDKRTLLTYISSLWRRMKFFFFFFFFFF